MTQKMTLSVSERYQTYKNVYIKWIYFNNIPTHHFQLLVNLIKIVKNSNIIDNCNTYLITALYVL